jgi:hypothetical protein
MARGNREETFWSAPPCSCRNAEAFKKPSEGKLTRVGLRVRLSGKLRISPAKLFVALK